MSNTRGVNPDQIGFASTVIPSAFSSSPNFPALNSLASASRVRRVRLIQFCPWAGPLVDCTAYLNDLPSLDLRSRVARPDDPALLQMARLDCDWHGENLRALNLLKHESVEFLPSRVLGKEGLPALISATPPADETWWFVLTGQHPQMLAGIIGRVLARLSRQGIRTIYYAFDEASRTMPCFGEIAPHLSVLIHDELPLAANALAALPRHCRLIHRSWVANLVPFAAPFVETPEEKIIFVGSKLGLTPHRARQIEFLEKKFGKRFVAVCDHSLSVADRLALGTSFKVGLCPEGRKFTTSAMRHTHTDRPFWSGCLGLVPVSEDSREGGRLDELHRADLIRRYPHGDLAALGARCEEALACDAAERRRIYDHYNRLETIGAVTANALATVAAA